MGIIISGGSSIISGIMGIGSPGIGCKGGLWTAGAGDLGTGLGGKAPGLAGKAPGLLG